MKIRSAGQCTAMSVDHLQFRYSKNGGKICVAVHSAGVISLCCRLCLCFVFVFKDRDYYGYKIILGLRTWRTVCGTLALVLTQFVEQ